MCGFAGFTGQIEQQKEILNAMMNRIVHRGPDMSGSYIGDGISLGFRRLSIIDLSEAACQPLFNEDRSLSMVFNGEIYNFMDLREELLSRGHIFNTETDSEVIVHGYEEYGTELVNKLRGMYAFAIWDSKTKSLFAARDIFGIKPFYYTKTAQGELIFGSEIKSFLEHPHFHKAVKQVTGI